MRAKLADLAFDMGLFKPVAAFSRGRDPTIHGSSSSSPFNNGCRDDLTNAWPCLSNTRRGRRSMFRPAP
jgi:hypothetical protein